MLLERDNVFQRNIEVLFAHQGEFPIGSYLKVKGSTKSLVTFLVLVRGNISLYHLKAYVYSFILSRGSKFLVPPSWLKMDFKSIVSLFFDLRPFLAMKGAPKNVEPRLKKKL